MGTRGIARFASEVNSKCLGASKSELLEEESRGCGSYLWLVLIYLYFSYRYRADIFT